MKLFERDREKERGSERKREREKSRKIQETLATTRRLKKERATAGASEIAEGVG